MKTPSQKLWFKRKLYGWGWTPATWQGWVVVLVYIVFIFGIVRTAEDSIPGNPDSGTNFLTFALPLIFATALLIYICYKKGEEPKWQWGERK